MSYHEEDFEGMLFAVEGRISHLFELDPTHTPADVTLVMPAVSARTVEASRSTLPFCLTGDIAAPGLLLELDPTHELTD